MNAIQFVLVPVAILAAGLIFTGVGSAQYEPKESEVLPLFANRDPAKREAVLLEEGGTKESEEAVQRGLKWLVREQKPDGRWMLDSPHLLDADRGAESNDVAATSFALLPVLAAGYTHKPARNNPHDKVVEKGLNFLRKEQAKNKNGCFGSGMYAHGLATIAICEAYGMTKDPTLRGPAQKAVNLIVDVQHAQGGWRYSPAKQAGDLSVSGWQIMALTTARAAGLNVPGESLDGARKFLDATSNADNGYGYTVDSRKSTARMTAVGLLCRQHLDNWAPARPR